MRIDDILTLPPDAQAHVAHEIFGQVVTAIVERVLETDATTLPARPLYNLFRAFATDYTADLVKTLMELKVRTEGDEDPEIKLEVARRLRLAYELRDDEPAQGAEDERCAADVGYWINNWMWARNPERKGLRVVPFNPFDRQYELLEWFDELIDKSEPGFLNKGRSVGASYLVTAYCTHRWKYFDQWSTILSSYSEDALHQQLQPDKCLIEKIRVILDALPTWQLPPGYNERDHFNFMSVVNPANGATITGILPANENLRSTRASVAFLDEFPFYKEPKNAYTILTDVTPCTIAFGTPNPGSWATELMKVVRLFVFPWTDDVRKPRDLVPFEVRPGEVVKMPRFKANWLQRNPGKSEADFDREHCCNTDISLGGTLIKPEWVDAAQRIRLEAIGECVFGLDPAGLGGDESALAKRIGPVVAPLSTWQADERTTTQTAVGLTRSGGGEYLYFDASGLGSKCRDVLVELGDVGFQWWGVWAQNPPDSILIGDDSELADERYADQTTMLWFELAARLDRTYRHLSDPANNPASPGDLIQLPNDDKLREQLLARRWEWRSGKIKLEDKRKMKKSPDRADAVSLTMCTHLQRQRNRPTEQTVEAVDPDIDRAMNAGGGFKIEF